MTNVEKIDVCLAVESAVQRAEKQAIKLRMIERKERERVAVEAITPVLVRVLPLWWKLAAPIIARMLVWTVVALYNRWWERNWYDQMGKAGKLVEANN